MINSAVMNGYKESSHFKIAGTAYSSNAPVAYWLGGMPYHVSVCGSNPAVDLCCMSDPPLPLISLFSFPVSSLQCHYRKIFPCVTYAATSLNSPLRASISLNVSFLLFHTPYLRGQVAQQQPATASGGHTVTPS